MTRAAALRLPLIDCDLFEIVFRRDIKYWRTFGVKDIKVVGREYEWERLDEHLLRE